MLRQTMGMTFAIRPLTADDAPAYRTLRLRALTEDPAAYLTSAEEYAGRLLEEVAAGLRGSENSLTLGAFDQTALLGIATLVRSERLKLRHRADVLGVYLAPEMRGRGLAQAMMGELISAAKQMPGLDVLELSVTETQLAAQHLYERLGFVMWGVQPDAVREGGQALSELHMQLRL